MTAIVARNVGKGYRQYAKPSDSLKELVLRRPLHRMFWALRGISFRHDSGSTLGVIGDNGAGKSTLLKLLAGTLKPSEGELSVQGRVSAILELGTGFHPDFSGLDNIRMGCAMLGLDAQEIEDRVPGIIEFSELADFIAQPVKTYSSGMYVRLAFSVVTSVDPQVLVVDEALSVGDQHFQKKSMDRMLAFREQGKSLVFCSHNLYHVKELCQTALWLDKGQTQVLGPVNEVVDAYQDHVRRQNAVSVEVKGSGSDASAKSAAVDDVSATKLASDVPAISQVRVEGYAEEADNKPLFVTHESFRVKVTATAGSMPLQDIHVGIVITRNDGAQCYGVSTAVDGLSLKQQTNGEIGVTYVIDQLPLLSGEYFLEVWLIDASSVHVYDSRNPCCRFRVRQTSVEVGMAWMPHRWEGVKSSA